MGLENSQNNRWQSFPFSNLGEYEDVGNQNQSILFRSKTSIMGEMDLKWNMHCLEPMRARKSIRKLKEDHHYGSSTAEYEKSKELEPIKLIKEQLGWKSSSEKAQSQLNEKGFVDSDLKATCSKHSSLQISKNLIGYLGAYNMNERLTRTYIAQAFFLVSLSQEEPKRVSKALSDPAWVEAMQEELLQFKLQNVWVLVDLPKGHRAIGTKWVYINKKDERGIVIKNKARLVAQGQLKKRALTMIEVFAPWLGLRQ
ncbi:putative ribonuclease H-like domain-containing protein [Tanacetum coccineum]|uniref:Ribonuclease H-like domain-containing protein n=1 Tax=Tanacetum coccineum TaxID=301880 RepID=A0ABQ5HKE0_9ASTR